MIDSKLDKTTRRRLGCFPTGLSVYGKSGFNGALVGTSRSKQLKKRTPKTKITSKWRFLYHCCVLCEVGMVAIFSASVSASPLSNSSFDRLASSCGPATRLQTLRAVAMVESHFEPLAIRDNSTRQVWTPPNLAAAVDLARDRLKKGHSLDLGIMQINSRNLIWLGMDVPDAFDPCRSIGAAQRILLSAVLAGGTETERQAALLISLSRYNSGRPLLGVANGYADQVVAAMASDRKAQGTGALPPVPARQWEIWNGQGNAADTSWVITNEMSTHGVGALWTVANATAPPLARGEPYEVSAYRESSAIQP